MVIILSTPKDVHIPFVATHLTEPPVIIDTTTIKDKDCLTFSIIGGQNQVLYKGEPLDDVTGVWLRRPTQSPAHLHLPVRPQDEEYCASALESHLSQLYCQFPEALWVSDHYMLGRAGRKSFQLRLAIEAGFIIPDTIFTSDPDEAKRFVARYGTAIVKPQARTFPSEGSLLYRFFSSKITNDDDIDYQGLHVAPAIFQAAIPHVSDIRVTVVGKHVFATKIVETRRQKGKVRDWRAHVPGNTLAFSSFKLPAKIAKSCVALVQMLGLNFGAIDLVESTTGQLFFLEINPNGQWAFVEQETGQQIGKALASLLQSR